MAQALAAGFDVAVVGAGIVGLAHALAAARRGKRVVVIERDAQANGASVRNFGFVTVTGQQRGACWRRALRSRQAWVEIAPQAGIDIVQHGLCVAARRPEALRVLEAYRETDAGRDCSLLTPAQAAQKLPALRAGGLCGALWSPHELRVESRSALPKLARWLEQAHGVRFLHSTLVRSVEPPRLQTTRGIVEADACIVCPGHELQALYAERIAAYRITTCKLHMLRVAPHAPGFQLGAAVMSDLGLVRYLGYAELPQAAALKARLLQEQPAELENGVHLIAVQSADGSLVVGDSHHYGETTDPFAPEAVDELILGELDAVLEVPARSVRERWIGVYASVADRLMLVDRPGDAVRIVIVTSGTGASTAFAIAEEVVGELLGPPA